MISDEARVVKRRDNNYVLRSLKSDEAFPLKGEMLVGRDVGCAIALVAGQVSGYHAKINVMRSGVYIEDLQSESGTFVNGKRIKGRVLLSVGDKVRFDETAFRLDAGEEAVRAGADEAEQTTPGNARGGSSNVQPFPSRARARSAAKTSTGATADKAEADASSAEQQAAAPTSQAADKSPQAQQAEAPPAFPPDSQRADEHQQAAGDLPADERDETSVAGAEGDVTGQTPISAENVDIGETTAPLKADDTPADPPVEADLTAQAPSATGDDSAQQAFAFSGDRDTDDPDPADPTAKTSDAPPPDAMPDIQQEDIDSQANPDFAPAIEQTSSAVTEAEQASASLEPESPASAQHAPTDDTENDSTGRRGFASEEDLAAALQIEDFGEQPPEASTPEVIELSQNDYSSTLDQTEEDPQSVERSRYRDRNRIPEKEFDAGTGPRLIITSAPLRGKFFELDDQESGVWKIGRGEDAFIQLTDMSVAADHAHLTRMDDGYQLAATHPKNFLMVNGISTNCTMLAANDRIQIGSTDIVFKTDETDDPNARESLIDRNVSLRHSLVGALVILAVVIAVIVASGA